MLLERESAAAPLATPPVSPSPAPLRERLGIVAVLAGALGLRLWHLGALSLWTDEGSTWVAASGSFGQLIHHCITRDASPPLYYLLTSVALHIGGDGEAQLRLVSALASVALVWLTYRLARLIAGRAEATLAAALTAVSPFQLMYAREARTYALVGCLTVAALYLFARAFLLGRRRAWPWYVLVSTLALYTQTIAILGVGVQAVFAVASREGRRRFVPWILAQAVVAALFLPWIIVSAKQMANLGESHWYIAPPDAEGVFKVVRAVLLSPISLVSSSPDGPVPGLSAWMPARLAWAALVLIPLVPLTLALWNARRPDARGLLLRFCAGGVLLPLLAVFVVSFRESLWLPRYFVLLTPMLAVLLAHGVTRMPARVIAPAWAALLILVGVYACVRVTLEYSKERWRDVAAYIAAERAPGRSVVLVPFDLDPYAFYNRAPARILPAFEVSHPSVPFASHFTPQQLDELEQAAREHARGYDEVWVVVRSPNSEVRREVVRRAERAAEEGRIFKLRKVWTAEGGPLRVERFEAPAR